jgi:YD repeat-containing protein
MHEYGGGADNIFLPPQMDRAQIDAAVEKIVEAARTSGDVVTDEEVASLQARLRESGAYRSEQWGKYRDRKLVASRSLAPGTVLVSNRFGHQELRRVEGGYVRDNGTQEERFDERGRLVRLSDRNKNFIRFDYESAGRVRIVDNFNRVITVVLNDDGRAVRVTGGGEAAATYKYNDKGQLIQSKDVEDNVFGYEYDYRSNLTAIIYADGTRREMTYYPLDQQENIRTFKETDGSVTEYTYVVDENDANHLTVGTTSKAPDGSTTSTTTHEFFVTVDPVLGEWTRRIIETVDGEVTDTEYNSAGRPVKIVADGELATFEYDAKARVTRKETHDAIDEMKYDEKSGKVSWVRNTRKGDPPEVTSATYAYDERGNLVRAESGDGRLVRLAYDDNGRISQVVRKDGSRIELTYNARSKPTEIRIIEVDPAGKDLAAKRIAVTYTASNEIADVQSPDGRAAALDVMGAFQELLELLRPAGVSLSL